MVHPDCYISVDVEAAGPIPGTYSLLSIGACVVGNPGQSFYSELKPISGAFVAKAMAVHGLSLETLKQTGEAPATAMARTMATISGLLGKEPASRASESANYTTFARNRDGKSSDCPDGSVVSLPACPSLLSSPRD